MLEVHEIHKTYEGQPLLRGVSFSVGQGETVCLLGPSGSGKSTLLRIIAGLDDFDSGRVLWDGADLAGVRAHLRRFGLMFQDYALFPHKTVAQNVAFGLEMQNQPRAEIGRRVAAALGQVQMSAFAGRRVTDLSGGEQQRVALARALAPGPRLLMFDEPLGALDRTLREDLLAELRRILRETDVPAIYVTHDQEEAFTIADRILLLYQGRIVQTGTPAQLAQNPVNGWAARFLGLGNVLEGTFIAGEPARLRTSVGEFAVSCAHNHHDRDPVEGLLRPAVQSAVAGQASTTVSGRVADVLFRRDDYRVTLENGLFFHLDYAPAVGQQISLRLPEVQCLGSAG
jgi:ABC-type Fe3+/spermidine/putrescine transport system ATPase subunit